jgi:hypothetical protein
LILGSAALGDEGAGKRPEGRFDLVGMRPESGEHFRCDLPRVLRILRAG